MGFTVSSLSAYTEQNSMPLVRLSIFNAKTAALIKSGGNVVTGIKTAKVINKIDTNVGFAAGATCGFSSSGTTTLTQRTLTVGAIKINESLCVQELEAKWTQTQLVPGSRYETLPFEQVYSELKAERISEALELAYWYGDTTSGNANLSKFDGFNKIIDAASGVIEANTTGGGYTQIAAATGITTSNAITIFQQIYQQIPVEIMDKEDLRTFCGWDTFRKLMVNITTNNLHHYNTDIASKDGEIIVPGTNLRVVAVNGLNNSSTRTATANNRIFAMRLSNMNLGVDLEDEAERFEIFFAKEADEVRFVSEFKAGVQISNPTEIVKFTLA